MIIVEKFDYKKYTTEKVSFQISQCVFNVGESHPDDWDILGASPLWLKAQGQDLTVSEQRVRFWEEIQKYLKSYQAKKQAGTKYKKPSQAFYFPHLIQLAELSKVQDLKLLYHSSRQHAEMVKRCVEWLAQQI